MTTCKKVYDPIGSFSLDASGNAHFRGVILMPLSENSGAFNTYEVSISEPIIVSNDGYNGVLLILNVRETDDSLKEQPADHYVDFGFTVKSEAIDFGLGQKFRIMVLHQNQVVANPDHPQHPKQCFKVFLKQVGYDPSRSFDVDAPVICHIHGPGKTGESVFVPTN